MEDGTTRARINPDVGERFLPLRRRLGVSSFGMNQIVLEPGQRGRIHRHQRQEEVYLVLEGRLDILIDGEESELGAGEQLGGVEDACWVAAHGRRRRAGRRCVCRGRRSRLSGALAGALTGVGLRARIAVQISIEEGIAMSWNLKGSYVETCSCELMCPCNLSLDHGATYDFCRVTLVFDIGEGEIDGTDIGGLTVALIADTPKVMTEGNWRLGVFIDDRASDGQAEKLGQVFGGQLGGPMAALAPLVGEMLGIERAPIEVRHDGLRHSVRIGDAIDFEIEDIVPFGVETGEPVRFNGMFHPVGSDLTMAEAKRSKINGFGIAYEGKTGLSKSEFSWAA